MNTETIEPKSSANEAPDKAGLAASGGSAFWIRQPMPFGKYDWWPTKHATLADAIRELDHVGNTSAEIINENGDIVMHSKRWWKKHGKDGRP